MTATVAYVLAASVSMTIAVLGSAWRLSARVTRWADEVAANTRETRRLARKHGRLKDRVIALERWREAQHKITH